MEGDVRRGEGIEGEGNERGRRGEGEGKGREVEESRGERQKGAMFRLVSTIKYSVNMFFLTL